MDRKLGRDQYQLLMKHNLRAKFLIWVQNYFF